MIDLSILYVMKLWLANSSQQFINNCRPFSDCENKSVLVSIAEIIYYIT